MSARALARRSARPLHDGWLPGAAEALNDIDLAPLEMFIHAPIGFIPDFSAPPPENPLPSFDDELASLRRVSPDLIRVEVARLRAARGRSAQGADYYEADPARALQSLVAVLARYWDRVVRPRWPRLRSVLEADVVRRARDLALYGSERLFKGIRPRLSAPDAVAESAVASLERRAAGEGLLLLPSAFAWPNVYAVFEQPWHPTLVYPASGAAQLSERAPSAAGDALALTVGRTKARILRAALEPRSASDLAADAGISAGAASQMLHRLVDAGLLTRERQGRRVRYTASARARTLLAAFEPH